MSYTRYKSFIRNGRYTRIPFIEIPVRGSDVFVVYDKRSMRLDLLSYQFYNDPNYGWLILQANPHLGPMEFNIEDGVRLRIPYPLETAIQGYEDDIARYDKLYGLD